MQKKAPIWQRILALSKALVWKVQFEENCNIFGRKDTHLETDSNISSATQSGHDILNANQNLML